MYQKMSFNSRRFDSFDSITVIHLLDNSDWRCVTRIRALALKRHMLIFLVYKLIRIGNCDCSWGKCTSLALLYYAAISSMMMIATCMTMVMKIVSKFWAIRTITKTSCPLRLIAVANTATLFKWNEKCFKWNLNEKHFYLRMLLKSPFSLNGTIRAGGKNVIKIFISNFLSTKSMIQILRKCTHMQVQFQQL